VTLNGAATTTVSGGHAQGDVANGFESILGPDFNDVLTGDGGNNNLTGGIGNDTLNGGGGADVIVGGVGADILRGGNGADRFLCLQLSDSATIGGLFNANADDIINGFEVGSDKIDLKAIDANLLLTGDQAFHIAGAAFDNIAGAIKIISGRRPTRLFQYDLRRYRRQHRRRFRDFGQFFCYRPSGFRLFAVVCRLRMGLDNIVLSTVSATEVLKRCGNGG